MLCEKFVDVIVTGDRQLGKMAPQQAYKKKPARKILWSISTEFQPTKNTMTPGTFKILHQQSSLPIVILRRER